MNYTGFQVSQFRVCVRLGGGGRKEKDGVFSVIRILMEPNPLEYLFFLFYMVIKFNGIVV